MGWHPWAAARGQLAKGQGLHTARDKSGAKGDQCERFMACPSCIYKLLILNYAFLIGWPKGAGREANGAVAKVDWREFVSMRPGQPEHEITTAAFCLCFSCLQCNIMRSWTPVHLYAASNGTSASYLRPIRSQDGLRLRESIAQPVDSRAITVFFSGMKNVPGFGA